ncbi:pilus assembly protein TadG-related protein [Aeromicrobium sp.]|uniref:pilus assembly protein TadG-related protein n=1 Tax=Aeromicrobium sp. TaxID=1871063 RepID=UPI0034236E0A
MRSPRLSRRHDRDESGAIVPMAALLMVVVLAFTAFAVDLGLQRAAVRDMQAVADAVALDTARDPGLTSCDQTALTAAATKSLARQGTSIGRSSPLVVTPGHLDPTTRQFVAGSNAGACDAVRIVAATTVDFAFAPVIGTDSGRASRAAVGSTDAPAVCFSAGTTALVLNTNQSALGPILRNILTINLGLVGYDSGLVGLHGLSIPIAELDTALKAGTGHALVDNANVSLGGFLLASASVLEQHGNAVRAQVLRTLAANVGALTISVTDILNLGTSGASGLTTTVDALDLVGSAIVSAAVEASNGKNALNISSLGLSVGPVSLADAKITVIEPPQIACGKVGVQAKTAQVRVDLQTGLSTGGLGIQAANLSLGVRVASGTATLSRLNCSGNPSASIVGDTSVASVVGYGGTGSARLTVLQLWPLPAIQVGLTGGVAQSSSEQSFTYPPQADGSSPGMRTYGSAVNLKLRITDDSLLGLGTLLGLVVNPVLSLANSVVEPLLDPVLSLLGIRLGTMDVTMLGRPSCNGVRLVG